MHSELSDLPLDFEFKGQPYICGLIDDDTMTRYERRGYVKQLRDLKLARDEGMYTDKEYRRKLRKLEMRQERGDFSLEMSMKSVKQEDFAFKTLPLMIRTKDGDLVSDMIFQEMLLDIPEVLLELMCECERISFPQRGPEIERKKKAAMEKIPLLKAEARRLMEKMQAELEEKAQVAVSTLSNSVVNS